MKTNIEYLNVGKNRTLVFFLFLFVITFGCVNAQISLKKNFKFNTEIQAFDIATYSTAVLSDGGVYTLRSVPVMSRNKIEQIAVNPTGSSVAVSGGKKGIYIYSLMNSDRVMFKVKELRREAKKALPTAMCYSQNARYFVVANTLGEIIVHSAQTYMPQYYMKGSAVATGLIMSSNNYFIAAGHGNSIDIWNFNTLKLRKTLDFEAEVTGYSFSSDAALLAVTTADGRLTVFGTRDWSARFEYNAETLLLSPSFHPEGKYVAVIGGNSRLSVINILSGKVEQDLPCDGGGAKMTRFFKDYTKDKVFMVSNTKYGMKVWDANGLNPMFGKIIDAEVSSKMNEWVKMMQGESMEDYAIRVNDESRLQQQRLFEQEIATRMASERISISNPFIGEYDTEKGTLNIGFDQMAPIPLNIPENEIGMFDNAENLSFDNAVYVLNESDEFEIAYIEVKNETTGKVYIYDNIGRTKLTAIEDDGDFVPLEIMQIAMREEEVLKSLKETVVAENKENKIISDNTQIEVRTEVISDVDADGEKILNYKIFCQYQVINKQFSSTEDFPGGGYSIEKSNAAKSLMRIIKDAFEGDFADYLSDGRLVKIVVTGSADASPIRGKIPYRGEYGAFVNEPYYKDGNLDNITLTKESGITTNEQLALARAAGVTDYIQKNIALFEKTRNEYEYHVEVAKERGGEFRRINVEFIIVDAFPDMR